jgi:glutaminase
MEGIPTVDLDDLVRDISDAARPTAAEGEVASYIPAVASAGTDRFGLAVVEMDGTEHVAGDADVPFPIQSISKAFTLVLALQKLEESDEDPASLWDRVGVEPSGDPFNSLVQLEHEQGIPRNPMINAGALIVDDVLVSHCQDAKASFLELMSSLAGEDVGIDQEVLKEEGTTGHRNLAMAYLMSSFGNMRNAIADIKDVYNHQCSVTMTARQLARAVRFLANDGVDPASGEQIITGKHARRVAAIMLTCGTYDASGEFAFNVGFPCKSGVAGGIVGALADQLGVCVWSPPLDEKGNSKAGKFALHELSARYELSIF